MRSLKSTSTTTTTTGKRKLAQTKEYPDSPPTTPSPPNVKTKPINKQVFDLTASPPAKRRRSSERIAQKLGQKRTSIAMEDDDGFVFKRASKQKRKTTVIPEETKSTSSKPVLVDFTADVCALYSFVCVDGT